MAPDEIALAWGPAWDDVASMEARDAALAREKVARAEVIGQPLMELEDAREPLAWFEKQLFQVPAKPAETPLAPQSVGASFQALSLQDEFDLGLGAYIPPDTMGAVGPDHFMEVINSHVALYTKAGSFVSFVTLDTFLAVNVSGTDYPRNGSFDPRVIYDRPSGRWLVIALERGNPSGRNNHVILAVSTSSDPTGSWYKYVVPVGQASAGGVNYFSDYDTLGTDDHGVYVAIRLFPSSGTSTAKIAALDKAALLAGSATTVYTFSGITDMYSTPQPAHNYDALATGDPAWFVATSTTAWSNVKFRRLTWSSGTPALDASSDEVITLPAYFAPVNAPALGSTTAINVGDDRLQMAVVRNSQLWTCRHIGVNSSGGGSGSIDRTGCEWIQINVAGGTASLTQNGRIYDSAASTPRFYFYPSIMVSGQGHAVLAFSGSKSTEYVGAYFTGRLASDSTGTMGTIALLKAGEASYQRLDSSSRNRWGDYSYTSLDPNDDMTLWTIQEYVETPAPSTSNWGTWVAELLAPAPTLNDLAASAYRGASGVVLPLTGTGFYDPGAGFTGRLDVQLAGGSPNGISGYATTYTDPTQAQVTFDIATSAAVGARDVVLTNPDGQTATVVGGFTVLNNAPTISDIADQTASEGTATAALPFTVGDVETAAGSLTLGGSSSNPTLIPNANLVFGGSGASRTLTITPAANQTGTATLTVTVTDADGGSSFDTLLVTVKASVRARKIFYNQSSFDGNDASANASDDSAIATDKSALLPGGTATFANYTSYTLGMNGIMIDIGGLPGTLTSSDFAFKVGNNATPGTWSAAPAPTSISIRAAAGANGSSRVTVLWANNAIQKQWLQVTVLADSNTGLAANDVFYFGNAVGECGNSTLNAAVTAADELRARNNQTLNAAIDNPYDYDRSGRVTAGDQLIPRNNQAVGTSALQLITAP